MIWSVLYGIHIAVADTTSPSRVTRRHSRIGFLFVFVFFFLREICAWTSFGFRCFSLFAWVLADAISLRSFSGFSVFFELILVLGFPAWRHCSKLFHHLAKCWLLLLFFPLICAFYNKLIKNKKKTMLYGKWFLDHITTMTLLVFARSGERKQLEESYRTRSQTYCIIFVLHRHLPSLISAP